MDNASDYGSEDSRARSVMDNASDFGSEDCRFESCRARFRMYPFALHLVAVGSPGVVARACNPVTWKLELLNNLKLGNVRYLDLCRAGVRAKLSVNMVVLWKLKVSRLSKEERTGSGPKGSSQKFPR
ncbi:unnamed protein product [Clavelina lepadiformis]|uniref:Uncharacterized protein n=1 Tax=Clavelina lepadiformis TaxID=159417 RepID=A0ABP0G281_CLALP